MMTKAAVTARGFMIHYQAEKNKHHHRHIPLLLLVFLGFETVFALWNLNPRNTLDITQGYLSAFYFFPLFNVIVYPLLIAVLSNRVCDMEVKGDTLKLLYTLQERGTFYHCKYLLTVKYLFLSALAQCLILLGIGKVYSFEDEVRPCMLLQFFLGTILVSCVILSIQQMLSLRSSNQILPLVAGLAGSFLGLFSMFFPPVLSQFFLWGYYGRFTFVDMSWNQDTRITIYYEVPFPRMELFVFFLFSILIYHICKALTLRKEI